MRIFVLSMALSGLLAPTVFAADACQAPPVCGETQTCGAADCCSHCGRHCDCEKQCRIVCEMKEVKKTVWAVKCGEICTLLPSCCHGEGCGGHGQSCCGGEGDCADGVGKKCDPCAAEKAKRYVPPKGGKIRELKTLEKKEVVCKVPVYKCVVVYTCPHCQQTPCATRSPAVPDEKAPAAPAPEPPRAARRMPVLSVASDATSP